MASAVRPRARPRPPGESVRPGRGVAWLLLGLLAVGGSLVGPVGAAAAVATPPPEPVIPMLIGREVAEAEAILAEMGLPAVVVVEPEGVEPDALGPVVRQDPDAGTPIDQGVRVILVVEALVEVPDLGGLTEDAARGVAQARGLQLVRVALGGGDPVVTGQEPEPGSLVPAGSRLTVSLEGAIVTPETGPRAGGLPLEVLVGGGGLVLVGGGGLGVRAVRRARQRRWVRENVRARVVASRPAARAEATPSTAPSVEVLVRPRAGDSEVRIRTGHDPGVEE